MSCMQMQNNIIHCGPRLYSLHSSNSKSNHFPNSKIEVSHVTQQVQLAHKHGVVYGRLNQGCHNCKVPLSLVRLVFGFRGLCLIS